MIPDASNPAGSSAKVGVAYGLAAYLAWGCSPIYFKAVADVPALEVLTHRVVWSVVLLIGLILMKGRWHSAVRALAHRKTLMTLCGSTLLIATNWFLFIWAVGHDQILQASLGYYINPLLNVLWGLAFLGERLRRWQKVSVGLASVGVGCLAIGYGQVPWIALILATSFGFYGLLRKTAHVDAMVGLTAETVLLFPLAVTYMGFLAWRGTGHFGTVSLREDCLLAFAGVITAVPLLWFTHAARRLRLATLGFLQYLAPTLNFLLAVFWYDEPFDVTHGISFGCIWVALAVYSVDTLRSQSRRGPAG